jgi:WD40 repeat protein
VWDLASGKPLFTHKMPGVAYYASYAPDGTRIVVGSADGSAYLIDIPDTAR